MTVSSPSFAKINLGLCLGARRPDGFHELRTIYQTIALHDIIRVSVFRGSGIEIRCDDPRVPKDSSNTCFRIADRVMQSLHARGRILIEIEKRLPVQGGLGGGSGNAVAAMLGLECALKKRLFGAERQRIAAEVGSDLPLFLVGGTILGVGRGEEVFPLPDLPSLHCVVATPEIAVSTPRAFADWDSISSSSGPKLTPPATSDRMNVCSREISAWLLAGFGKIEHRRSGVSTKGGGRAESLQLDLVRTGIENDFEKVVFPQYPELSQVKSVLEQTGARYASLSGSGSAIYGLFESREKASAAAKKLNKAGVPAVATTTLTRRQYWKQFLATSS